MQKMVKVAGTALAATGIVAASAVAASGAAVYSVAKGIKTAGRMIIAAVKANMLENRQPQPLRLEAHRYALEETNG